MLCHLHTHAGAAPKHRHSPLQIVFSAVEKEGTNPLAVLAGMDKETAQKEYITLVKSLAEKYAK